MNPFSMSALHFGQSRRPFDIARSPCSHSPSSWRKWGLRRQPSTNTERPQTRHASVRSVKKPHELGLARVYLEALDGAFNLPRRKTLFDSRAAHLRERRRELAVPRASDHVVFGCGLQRRRTRIRSSALYRASARSLEVSGASWAAGQFKELIQPFWERGALLLAMRAEFRCCAIRGTMSTVNDQLGYRAGMRLMVSGLSREFPVSMPQGRARFVFWREETARVRGLVSDYI